MNLVDGTDCLILESRNSHYRISLQGERLAKLIHYKNKITLWPTGAAAKTKGEREMSIQAPAQFIVCSKSLEAPASPISLPSPTLSESSPPSVSPVYYSLSGGPRSGLQFQAQSDSKKQLIGDAVIIKEESARIGGKRKLWMDGRLFPHGVQVELVIMALALRVLEASQ